MKNNTLKKLSTVLIAIGIVNLIAAVIFVLTLPDTVPVHFNASLVCDRVGSKWNGLIAPVLIAIVFPICLLFEGKGKNAEKNAKPLTIFLSFIDIMLIAVCWFVLFSMKSNITVGEKLSNNFDFLIPLITGLMLVVIGNYLPTVRQNKTLGIKLPWTLKNEKCWDKTHRFSGKLYVILGLLIIAATFTLKLCGITTFVPYVAILLIMPALSVIIPSIYAYNHRND